MYTIANNVWMFFPYNLFDTTYGFQSIGRSFEPGRLTSFAPKYDFPGFKCGSCQLLGKYPKNIVRITSHDYTTWILLANAIKPSSTINNVFGITLCYLIKMQTDSVHKRHLLGRNKFLFLLSSVSIFRTVNPWVVTGILITRTNVAWPERVFFAPNLLPTPTLLFKKTFQSNT